MWTFFTLSTFWFTILSQGLEYQNDKSTKMCLLFFIEEDGILLEHLWHVAAL